MSRLQRSINLTIVFLPPVCVAILGAVLWGKLLGPGDIVIAASFYLITGFGITIGYHRLLTHHSFATHRPIERALSVMGALALEGPPSDWVADHRKHHANTDQDGDPHSPHAGRAAGVRGALRGLWHAHVGWLFAESGRAEPARYAPELVEDRFMRAIRRQYHWFALASFVLPAMLGLLISGSWHGALTGLLWGGLVRIVAVHHITWSVNSVCHFFGRRRFAIDDHSTNVAWLALPSLGESWHHNHHAFGRSAFHGLRPWEALLDPSGWVIRAMRRLGLAWNVVAIPEARQTQRLAA